MRFEVSDLLSGVMKYWFSETSQLVLGVAARNKQEPVSSAGVSGRMQRVLQSA